MHPRPILKRASSSSNSAEKHAVHFPPSPALTRTFVAHSPAAYDRSPIVVAPNICALPERGGRTYVLDDQPTRRRSCSKSGHLLHPRGMRGSPSVPPLIPDLSSESDESDGLSSPHLENQEFFFGLKATQQQDDAAHLLSFLPYAPSNPYQQPGEEEQQEYLDSTQKRRRRIVVSDQQQDEVVLSPPRRKSRSRSKLPCKESSYTASFSLSDSFSSFALRDDGCLGGF